MELKSNLNIYNVGGDVIKSNETYTVIDNTDLNHLVLSLTALHPYHSTTGHSHKGQEEVYIFVKGAGYMIVGEEDDESFPVSAGDIVLIPDGAFHKVFNHSDENLIFNCIFDGGRKELNNE